MSVIEIKSIFGAVIYSREAENLHALMEKAVEERANLRGADLRGSNLRGSNLSGSDLSGSDLGGADLDTGETWEKYLGEVVPALLTAGGKTIKAIVAAGAWKCHSWENCPMAEAFSVRSLDDCPILLRTRVEQFVRFFDMGLIPQPEVA